MQYVDERLTANASYLPYLEANPNLTLIYAAGLAGDVCAAS